MRSRCYSSNLRHNPSNFKWNLSQNISKYASDERFSDTYSDDLRELINFSVFNSVLLSNCIQLCRFCVCADKPANRKITRIRVLDKK